MAASRDPRPPVSKWRPMHFQHSIRLATANMRHCRSRTYPGDAGNARRPAAGPLYSSPGGEAIGPAVGSIQE
jgi:hypothetical protein